ncbi:MAG: YqjF family protein [Gaiellaceae bacterium]
MSGIDFLDGVARQARVMDDVSHRPWPAPGEPWTQAQSWLDVAFLHWRVDEAVLRRLVPRTVELDTFDGSAWLGITPFVLSGLRLRGLPPLPGVSRFTELNVRTYVTHGGKPGIWFFSLDAASTVAVEAAKRLYKLPYHRAQMHAERVAGFVLYESARPGAAFSGRYRGVGSPSQPEPGSLEHFLAERYCLYTEDGGRLYRAEIHHPRWDVQRGEAHVDLNTMAPLPLPDEGPHVLFAPRQDVVVWPLEELTGTA